MQALHPLTHGRYTIQVAANRRPEELMTELTVRGATVESLNPLRDTLEDYFVKQIGAANPRETAGV